jgi:hypothetical protein
MLADGHVDICQLGVIPINDKEYKKFESAVQDFLHEGVTKNQILSFRNAMANAIDRHMKPVRAHFQTSELQQLIKDVAKF